MGRKAKAEERLGMIFTNKDGCKFFIKEYINRGDVIVKFMDEQGAEVHTAWQCCEKGRVKNPYYKSMSKKSKAEERVGMVFISKDGSKFFVKDYVDTHNVIIKFIDEHGVEKHTTWDNCKKGKVKNPYYQYVYGVGYLGEGDFVTGINGKITREYILWQGMLKRCYYDEYLKEHPTYINVTVCERWLCFANFLEDLPLIENYELWLNSEEKMSLDKDLKQVGVENKVYSLDTVKFVTASENTKEANGRKWGK